MGWLERHAWWGLVVATLTIVAFGVTDIVIGPASDPGIPRALIGLSPAELEAESPAGYRLFDFTSRTQGSSLALFGLLGSAIVVFAYRRNQRWAWWTMWTLPAWAAGVFLFYLVAGVQPDEPPPPPMVSGPIFTAVTMAIQLVSARRFFPRHPDS